MSVRGGLLLAMFAPKTGEDLEMGIIGSQGMLQTKMARDEILQWKRSNDKADPIVHHVPTKKVGWGAHHGFVETHAAFFEAIVENKRPLTDVRNCVDGTLLAIAAEEAIKTATVVTV